MRLSQTLYVMKQKIFEWKLMQNGNKDLPFHQIVSNLAISV